MIEMSDLDDAVCVIEISPPVYGSYDTVTGLELARAAFSIVENCVSSVELGRVGGEVRGLGTSNGLESHSLQTQFRIMYQSCATLSYPRYHFANPVISDNLFPVQASIRGSRSALKCTTPGFDVHLSKPP